MSQKKTHTYSENLEHTSSPIALAIVQFCREHRRFHSYELREAVARVTGIAAPASADRGLRALRQQGVIRYEVISRRYGLYQVTAINADAEGSVAMEVLNTASLEELEAIIEKGFTSFIDTGNALREIRKRHLYEGFATFEEYCLKRWNMSRFYGHRMIEAAEVAGNLLPMGNIPQTERQARELAHLSPERQREVAAAIDFQHATAAQIRALVRHESPAVKPKTKRSDLEFCRRLFKEFMHRRREADLANSKRVWNPDAICKVDLINILVWVESELQTYINGRSVNRREKAKKRPQQGKGTNHDRETNVGIDPADAGISATV